METCNLFSIRSASYRLLLIKRQSAHFVVLLCAFFSLLFSKRFYLYCVGEVAFIISSNVICFSVNLMASMGTLTTVAKQRPQFMSTVVQAFETLHGMCIVCKAIILSLSSIPFLACLQA